MTGKPTPLIDKTLHTRLRKVLFLATKFDCPQVINTIYLILSPTPWKIAPWSYSVAITGAMFDNPDLVYSGMKGSSDSNIPKPVGEISDIGIDEGIASDPGSWSWEDWKRLPATYAWAMQRAFRQGKTDKERSERFKVLIEKVKGK